MVWTLEYGAKTRLTNTGETEAETGKWQGYDFGDSIPILCLAAFAMGEARGNEKESKCSGRGMRRPSHWPKGQKDEKEGKMANTLSKQAIFRSCRDRGGREKELTSGMSHILYLSYTGWYGIMYR